MSDTQPMPNDEIWTTGANLLKLFGTSLFSSLESQLKDKWGEDWFGRCTEASPSKSHPVKKDLQGLLKEIVDYNNQVFRLAISKSFFSTSSLHKSVLEDFAQIKKSRNDWFHEENEPSKQLTHKDLLKLVTALLRVSKDLSIVAYCNQIERSLSEKNMIALVMASPSVARHENEIVANSEKYKELEERLAGEIKAHDEKSADGEEAYKFVAHAWRVENYRHRALRLQFRGKIMGMLWKIVADTPSCADELVNDYADREVEPFKSIWKLQKSFDEAPYEMLENGEIEAMSEDIRKTLGKGNCSCPFCFNQTADEMLAFLTQEDYDIGKYAENLFLDHPNVRFTWVG